MPKYEFDITRSQTIIVEADDAETARMMIINREVDSILDSPDDIVSDGWEIKED